MPQNRANLQNKINQSWSWTSQLGDSLVWRILQ
jgi:hypothetical protein